MYIRYFADTTDSAIGKIALGYLRSLVRVAPVRVVTFSGDLFGAWCANYALLTTPMVGRCVNTVCLDPSRWVWQLKVPAPRTNQPGTTELEVIEDERELYTDGMRNVLFAPCLPRSRAELGTALRYESLIVPSEADAVRWRELGGAPVVIELPVTDHKAVKTAVN